MNLYLYLTKNNAIIIIYVFTYITNFGVVIIYIWYVLCVKKNYFISKQ
jgi:hypothetical protein